MFLIPIRNLWRNRRRTILSLSVIAACAAVLVLVDGFVNGSLQGFEDALTSVSGHMQLAPTDYWNQRTADPARVMMSSKTVERIEQMLAANSDIAHWSRSLDVSGLIGHQERSTMMIAQTLDDPTDLAGTRLVVGDHISSKEAREILVGQGLAEQLQVTVGDRINIAALSLDGAMNAITVSIVGIVRFFDSEADMFAALMPLPLAQLLLRIDGVNALSIHLKPHAEIETVRKDILRAVEQIGLDLFPIRWDELSSEFADTQTFFHAIRSLARSGLILLGFFSILQIVTLSFLERTREVGTLRAIGTPQRRVLFTLLTEGALLGLLGSIAGCALGLGLSSIIGWIGPHWQFPGIAEPQKIRLLLQADSILIPLCVTWLTTFIAVIAPASRGASTRIVRALRHV